MEKQFSEKYLEFNQNGYFDENFEELILKDICKRVGVNKKDVDEIIEKTNFEVEGAIYYKSDGKRVFVKGEKNYVDVPFIMNIQIFIHSHPKGTSFSVKDVELSIENKIKHLIAFNNEYFYSLKFYKNITISDNYISRTIDEVYDGLFRKVQRGEISNSQLNFSINHKIWKKIFKNIKGVNYEYYKVKK